MCGFPKAPSLKNNIYVFKKILASHPGGGGMSPKR